MTIHELTVDQCREVLARKNIAHLACSRDDQPYIVPILCYFDGAENCLYSVAAAGQKVEWMRANPKVCVAFSEIGDQFNWITVAAFGRYEEVSDSAEDAELRRRAHALFEQRHEWWFPAMQKPEPGEPALTVVYRVRIDRLTGRRGVRQK